MDDMSLREELITTTAETLDGAFDVPPVTAKIMAGTVLDAILDELDAAPLLGWHVGELTAILRDVEKDENAFAFDLPQKAASLEDQLVETFGGKLIYSNEARELVRAILASA